VTGRVNRLTMGFGHGQVILECAAAASCRRRRKNEPTQGTLASCLGCLVHARRAALAGQNALCGTDFHAATNLTVEIWRTL
jgi:hypothetical protein